MMGVGCGCCGESIVPGSDINKSALEVAKRAMEVVSENIANQHTTRGSNGRAYKAKQVVIGSEGANEGEKEVTVVDVVSDEREGDWIYRPNHPHANEEGFLETSNVNLSQEMVNLIKYSRWMEAIYAADSMSFKIATNAMSMGGH